MKRVVYCYTFSSERKNPIPGQPVLTEIWLTGGGRRRTIHRTPSPPRSGDTQPSAEGGPGPQA